MLLHTWAPQVLRSAGLTVVETSGWTNRSHGSYPDSLSAIWHHDASPPGDSPGALQWMISNWDNASANFWVNRYGHWYCVGTGVSWQAGVVLSGMPNNFTSFGVETDQTINETPTQALLDGVRTGMAALLKHMGRSSQSLWFHKSVAPMRKQDPWLGATSADRGNWPTELTIERGRVQNIINGTVVPPLVPPKPKPKPPVPVPQPVEEDDMAFIITTGKSSQSLVVGDRCLILPDSETAKGLGAIGIKTAVVSQRGYDYLLANLKSEKDNSGKA